MVEVRIPVAPYVRWNEKGNLEHVDAHWRTVNITLPGEEPNLLPRRGFKPDKDYYRASWRELPAKLFHVAPRSARSSIEAEGLDATGRSFNWALSPNDQEAGGSWKDDYYTGPGSDRFTYRPEGVYVFADGREAVAQARRWEQSRGEPFDIWEVDTASLQAAQGSPEHETDVLRDPEYFQQQWQDPEDRAYPEQTAEEFWEELKFQEFYDSETGNATDDSDQRSYVFERVHSDHIRRVQPYEVKEQDWWTDEDTEAYLEDHPEAFDDGLDNLLPLDPDVTGVKKRDLDIDISPTLRNVLADLDEGDHRALIVGGAVRDSLMGEKSKDIDIEVYGTSYEDLDRVLRKHGRTDLVGQAFGVIKFTDADGNTYDFSLPRRDNRVGVGHRGFETEFDPTISFEEAASRRDFTMNALAYDPIRGELHDYFGGEQDIADRKLRHTSDAFAEDPLRVLRGMQFAARFGLTVDPETAELSRSIANRYSELPTERVTEEFMKLARAREPGRVFEYLEATGWDVNFPQLKAMHGIEQDPEWHPEGDVAVHAAHAMNAAARIADREGLTGDDRATIVLAAMAHDMGKVTHSQVEGGRVRSKGHAGAGAPMAKEFLNSIGIKRDITDKVVPIVATHMDHVNFDERSNARAVRRYAQRLRPATVNESLMVVEADNSGRPPRPEGLPPGAEHIRRLAEESGVTDAPMPRLIEGREVLPYFDIPPGPHIGEVVREAYEAQLDGAFSTLEEGREWLRRRMFAASTFPVAGIQPPGTKVYHYAPTRLRSSIEQGGLDFSLGDENHSLDFERGNYVWSTRELAELDMETVDTEPLDLWEVDVSGLELRPDPEQVKEREAGEWDGPQSSWFVPQAVSSERLRRVDPNLLPKTKQHPFQVAAFANPDHYILDSDAVPDEFMRLAGEFDVTVRVHGADASKEGTIFDALEAHYRPATREITMLHAPGIPPEWAQAALYHEMGHALLFEENGEPPEGVTPETIASNHTEAEAWERGVRWAQDQGLPWDKAHELYRHFSEFDPSVGLDDVTNLLRTDFESPQTDEDSTIESRFDDIVARSQLDDESAAPWRRRFLTVDAAEQVARARYGFADFTGLESEADLEELSNVLQRLDQLVDEYPFVMQDPPRFSESGDGWHFRGVGTYFPEGHPREGEDTAAPARVRHLAAEAWAAVVNGHERRDLDSREFPAPLHPKQDPEKAGAGPYIWLNADEFSNGLGMTGEMGYVAPVTPAEGLTHEFGHVVHEIVGNERVRRAFERARVEAYKRSRNPELQFLRDVDSVHAGSGWNEGFAELFYRLNQPGAMDGMTQAAQRRLKRMQRLINEEMGLKVI